MSLNALAELRSYMKVCESLIYDDQSILDDLVFSTEPECSVLYAVDFTEIYAYVFPTRGTETLEYIYKHLEDRTALNNAILEYIFFEADRSPIILNSHQLELKAFLESSRDSGIKELAEILEAAERQYKNLLDSNADFFASIAELRESGLTKNQVDQAVMLIEKHAPTIALLTSADELRPASRLQDLFKRVSFKRPNEIVEDPIILTDEEKLIESRWIRKLTERRVNYPISSNELDGNAIAQLIAINRMVPANIRVRLITRSEVMHLLCDEEPECKNASGLLRRPRAFVACLGGLTHPEQAQSMLRKRIANLSLVRATIAAEIDQLETAIRNDRMNVRSPRGREKDEIARMMANIKKMISELNLDNTMIENLRLGRGLVGKEVNDNSKNVLIDLSKIIHILKSESRVGEAIRTKALRVLEDVNRKNISLASAIGETSLGRSSEDPLIGLSAQRISHRVGAQPRYAVLRSRQPWMPYVIHFHSNLIQRYITEGKEPEAALRKFLKRERTSSSLEKYLALAFLFAVRGNWDVAFLFCDEAVTSSKEDHEGYSHEAYYFRAVTRRKSAHASSENVRNSLYDLRIATKQQKAFMEDKSYEDPRYLNEYGVQLSILNKISEHALEAQESRDVMLPVEYWTRALTRARAEHQLRMFLYNNLVYYFVEQTDVKKRRHALDYLNELQQLKIDAERRGEIIPINVIDTLVWAEWQLKNDIRPPVIPEKLLRELEQIIISQPLPVSERAAIEEHVREIREAISSGL